MLGVEGLTVRYGPIEAVRGIGFEVKRGEVFSRASVRVDGSLAVMV